MVCGRYFREPKNDRFRFRVCSSILFKAPGFGLIWFVFSGHGVSGFVASFGHVFLWKLTAKAPENMEVLKLSFPFSILEDNFFSISVSIGLIEKHTHSLQCMGSDGFPGRMALFTHHNG